MKIETLHNSRSYPWSIRQVPIENRNPSFFYGGGIRQYQNFGKWFHDPIIQKFPINMYGWIREFDSNERAILGFNNHNYLQKYHGLLPSDIKYYDILSKNAYSIVLWSPEREDTYYACPNKMYDSIAYGIPFISGPNPLAKYLVEKYECGIIMPDWNISCFESTLRDALANFQTGHYKHLVEGCKKAMDAECEWEKQFTQKITPHITAKLQFK